MNAELLQRIECGTTTVADAVIIRQASDWMLQIAGRIADAAAFLDAVRATLAERDRVEASIYVDFLHSAAQLLAGERQHEIYCSED